MAQTREFKGVARRITRTTNATEYHYHDTAIVVVRPDGSIRLDSGTWRTVTTKTAMNQASNQDALGFNVYQKNYDWYVSYQGNTYDFKDGMVLAPDGTLKETSYPPNPSGWSSAVRQQTNW